jgi:hypothetical protein
VVIGFSVSFVEAMAKGIDTDAEAIKVIARMRISDSSPSGGSIQGKRRASTLNPA